MSKMLKEHSTSDEKAYMIRNLNKIENRTEFFELIGKTKSSVTCTADGLAINNMIDIAPEAYNDIGKAVFTEKLNLIGKARDGFLHEKVMEEFDKYISPEKREEFEAKLKSIENLPREKQEEAMKKLVKDFATTGSPTQKQLNDSWKTVETACEQKFNKNVEDMIGNLKEGSTGDAARDKIKEDDFKELNELAKKQLHGTITPEEQEKLKKQLEKCSSHRKEYFFKSSADHRNDANTTANNEAFKKDINTFTNGQNERLCYRINVEDVKIKLRDIYGVPNHEDITINGQKPFANMKLGDYDRLNRVLKDYGPRGKKLVTAATNIANDPNFIGKVKTPHDMASVTEAINKGWVLRIGYFFSVYVFLLGKCSQIRAGTISQ
jgi:Skp family chaperone for outer membrane proteins